MTQYSSGSAYAQRRDELLAFFSDEVAPVAAEADRTKRYPRKIISRAAQLGLLAAVARSRGGTGWDELSIGLLHEAAGRHCTALRSLLTVQGVVTRSVERWGSEDQKDRWVPKLASGEVVGAFCASEAAAGSDLSMIRSTAMESEGGYLLNGEKLWVTFGGAADVFLVLAKLEDRPAAFLVQRALPGVDTSAMPGMLGLRGAEISRLRLENVEVARTDLIGAPGAGLLGVANYALDFGRFSVAWGAIGLAAACLAAMARHSTEPRASGSKLFDHQLVKAHLADTATELRMCQELCKTVATRRDAGFADSVMEVSMAKYAGSRLAMTAAWRCLQVMGAVGMEGGTLPERFFRDAKVLELIEGSHEIQQIVLSSIARKTAEPL